MNKFFSLLTVLVTLCFTSAAQQINPEKCAFDYHYQEQMNDPTQKEALIATEKLIQSKIAEMKMQDNKTAAAVVTIPVVFHIIYASSQDNISIAQIEDGLRILNEDYRRQNADTSQTRAIFKPVAADFEIQFALAKKDPQGNCTDGITRTQSIESLSGDEGSKIIKWNRNNYLNIWVTRNVSNTLPSNPNGYTLGYSFFPRNNSLVSGDGVILRHDQLGTIGTATGNPGRTLTHEVGHYLALHHPFAGGCNGNGGSNPVGNVGGSTSGDYCADTPPVFEANNGCSPINTCSNDSPNLTDQIENYMDYTDCQNMFTEDQKARARAVINSSALRANLVSQSNLIATGVVNPPACTPTAMLESPKNVVCVNEVVQFNDISEDGTPSTWNWTFPGGTPSSSTAENPTVTYANPGKYDVSLSVSNSAGTNSTTLTNYLNVKSSINPFFNLTWVESFELGSIPATVSIIDKDQNPFKPFSGAGSHLSNSLILEKVNNVSAGDVDEIITPAIATAGGSNLNLYFDYAFAAQSNDNNDELEVYVSRDCGATWIRRRFYNSGRLRTAPNTTGNFVPNGPSQWTTETLNFDAYIQNDPILIKFVFNNGGGNNFYIDNIRFGQGTDVSINEFGAADLKLYPNPSNGQLTIKMSDLLDNQLNLEIVDLGGRSVYSQSLQTKNSSFETQLDLGLSTGVYLLNIKGDHTNFSQKLIIE
ncbi:MAG: hypothetical protein DA405_04890 [Bacteroidetes bacterium]|nr:MAG: hypothetical protein DA405_04890 [Bacteroidota bacterium]